MSRKLISTALVLSVISLTPQISSANDIIDFLRAINGAPSHSRHVQTHRVAQHRGHDHVAIHDVRDRYDRSRYRSTSRSFQPVRQRSGLSFNVSFGNAPVLTQAPAPVFYNQAPAPILHAPAPVLPPPPIPGSFDHLPHELGYAVTCPVALEPHVQFRNLCNIAPGAIPTVIAVRDPHLGRHRSRGCVESLVYVQVMAPQCPVRSVRVSPCKTRIRLDYGKYEIDIVSKNDCVVVTYRD